MTTKQARWQARKKAAGLCINCGKRPLLTSVKCSECHFSQLEDRRKVNGYAPWQPGSQGKKPIY